MNRNEENFDKNNEKIYKTTTLDPKIFTRGTYYIKASAFKKYITSFDFRAKHKNDIGIQIADLCAYPLVSNIRNPKEPNLAFGILKEKIYQKAGKLYGFKIHP
jgi:hypothetical protein